MSSDTLLDVLNKFQIENLRDDITATKSLFETKGWTPGTLYRETRMTGEDSGPNYRAGSMCMTGAAGMAVEGSSFLGWIRRTSMYGTPVGYRFQARTSVLLMFLAETGANLWRVSDKYDFASAPYSQGAQMAVSQIIGINDDLNDQEDAIRWVDKALALIDAKLDELDPPKPVKVEVLSQEWVDRLIEDKVDEINYVT
jgi:hypothetical protein